MNDKNEREQHVVIEAIQKDVRKKTVERLLSIRKSLNMTQTDVAEITGLSCSNICRLEKGKCNFSLDMLVLIANAMDCDIDIQFIKRK
ncbi:helix-turn-helix domain-containing protein [Parablautia muri]|uniref:XRE family transcriptional regulator n=1 Tax=Parablautia muri TaxID=2320879 RepID=A0A9X5BET2_9FIRM|nr:helix-turn-helix transcriptional regulator [Parablautia muri]NBJ92580.1 XRE family transcriptional regulator [Parablautia muri]